MHCYAKEALWNQTVPSQPVCSVSKIGNSNEEKRKDLDWS